MGTRWYSASPVVRLDPFGGPEKGYSDGYSALPGLALEGVFTLLAARDQPLDVLDADEDDERDQQRESGQVDQGLALGG